MTMSTMHDHVKYHVNYHTSGFALKHHKFISVMFNGDTILIVNPSYFNMFDVHKVNFKQISDVSICLRLFETLCGVIISVSITVIK